ncbi:GntR family transcriptional regulator [Dethiosulfatibacter aminovorans DSM 17477]|uniref:GntR family transcriptional regulator n=1 Tax=Dethiosulfatibacter aminovorans DSM 17477 TaxID=1121476 RepID=A0A1M6B0Z0_9FIRM|nr:GntR family transcriptional regulator [Dethiosulfatibacter aminovorans]SHI42337.1 GntR family transcriptional regulator [Dethiosulfatibacter aminovorans DSM 17477]
MIIIDSNSTKSIYEQIYDEFVRLITTKVLKPDEKLPSVRELATMVRINPNTIQKAYKLLESKQFIYSVPGKGNFVAENDNIVLAEIKDAEDNLKSDIRKLKKLGVGDERILSLAHDILKGDD